MSDAFRGEIETAQHAQLVKNDARRIRTKVDDARKSPHLAGARWPFELLQNAHDAHPRPGNASIAVLVDCRDRKLTFEHDSMPFTAGELAALLSGGSGKEFDSEDTTGRFGTGFLSTHVLATRVEVSGICALEGGFEHFETVLDRDGDEHAIVGNIGRCAESFRNAKPLESIDGIPSARFVYEGASAEIVRLGMDALREALPYLFSTCDQLGRVEIRLSDGTVEQWIPTPARLYAYADGFVRERLVSVEGARHETYRSLRFSAHHGATAAALLLARRTDPAWSVLVPGETTPRVYRQFPIRPSDFLQTSLVIDAPFDVNQERSRVHLKMGDKEHARNRALAHDGLAAWKLALVFAFDREWIGRHQLARLRLSDKIFADETGGHGFWRDEIASLANHVALMPLVQTSVGYARAVRDDGDALWADFLVPRLAESSSATIDIERFWPVMEDVRALLPPIAELAREWSDIAADWRGLGVPVDLATLETIARAAKHEATRVNDLNLMAEDHLGWIARFVDLVGECWVKTNAVGSTILDGLLPDQQGKLRAPGDLSRDGGAQSALKDTAAVIGINMRSRLLDGALEATAAEQGLQYFARAIASTVQGVVDDDAIVDKCLTLLDAGLSAGKPLPDSQRHLHHGSVRLLQHIWSAKGAAGRKLVHRCPFIASNKYVVRWSGEPGNILMAPVDAWHESARPFAHVYGESRVLHADYRGDGAGLPDVVGALVAWGVAHPDPLIVETPQKVDPERLRGIAESPEQAADVTVSNVPLSQIALLNEVIPAAAVNQDAAGALLGLVLRYVAREDARWRELVTVSGRKKGGGDVSLRVRGAHWLAHLRTRSWVPLTVRRAESVEMTTVPASPATLRPFLEKAPEWLNENEAAISLLSECFEFDALELRLLGVTSDDATRRKLRSGLARIVEVAGAEPELLERLAGEVAEGQKRRARIQSSRNLGLAVQEAIRQSLEQHRLNPELIDHGFDYQVSFDVQEPVGDDEPGMTITVGKLYLIEVKSTRTGEVRLTPTQAMTASREKQRYVLCVVDLRTVPADTLDRTWTAADVEPLTRMVADIGASAEKTWNLIAAARSMPVAIRKDDELRYGVPESVWSPGISIAQWVTDVTKASSEGR